MAGGRRGSDRWICSGATLCIILIYYKYNLDELNLSPCSNYMCMSLACKYQYGNQPCGIIFGQRDSIYFISKNIYIGLSTYFESMMCLRLCRSSSRVGQRYAHRRSAHGELIPQPRGHANRDHTYSVLRIVQQQQQQPHS
jgi:hypothetical protein